MEGRAEQFSGETWYTEELSFLLAGWLALTKCRLT
jgi:hypothetical protein